MSRLELGYRRITSIPSITSLDVARRGGRRGGGVAIRIGGGSLLGGVRRGRVLREVSTEKMDWSKDETNWGQVVAGQVVHTSRETARPKSLDGRDRKIEWKIEVIKDYNNRGGLGIIVEFDGIQFTEGPFRRSKHDSPDSPVRYIPIAHNKKMTNLFLATWGDICRIQIADQMDVSPFLFQKELYLPQLTTTYDPTTMAVSQNNGLIIVGYNPRTV